MTNIKPKTHIRCRLSAGHAHGGRMGLSVMANSETIYQSAELTSDTVDLEFELDLPMILQFSVHGKLPGQTEVDDHGNILRDKCVILEGLCVNSIWVKKWMLENKLVNFRPENGEPRINNYFGQNGVASISIPYDNLLEFWLDLMTVDH